MPHSIQALGPEDCDDSDNCEYAEGAVRWVVYRQLREFLSLHGHYAVSKAYNRNIDALPDFPMTSTFYPSTAVADTDSRP